MRSSLAFVLVATLAGCGGSSGNIGDPDASGPTADGGLEPPARGFQIVSPTVDIDPGADITYCYYFRTPNTSDLAIKKWASHMTPGGHHMIVYLTPGKLQDTGTLVTLENKNCGLANIGMVGPVWTYSAQIPDYQTSLPADDGNGVPVAQVVKAGQLGFIQMHYQNATDAVIHAHVELNAYAYDDGVPVTQAEPFVTFDTQINLPAAPSPQLPTTGTVSGKCNVTSNLKFFVMTTYTHKQGVHTSVKDGAITVFDSTNWEHPGTQHWDKSPYFSFTSGKLTYQCEYLNPNSYQILYGDSATTQEMCMAIGYYFPAVDGGGRFCLDSLMLN